MDINFIKWSNLAMNATSKRIMTFSNGFRNRIPSDRQLEKGEHGFSLIELLIASFVLAIGVLSVAAMIGTSISRNLSSKNDTIAMAAAEQVMEELNNTQFSSLTVGGSTLQADGRLLFENPSDGSAYPTVDNYSRPVPLANSDQVGKTVTYDVRWNIASAFNDGTNRLLRITIGARRQSSNLRLQPVQLVFVKAQ
jgi:type IV pilus modification protein PilV